MKSLLNIILFFPFYISCAAQEVNSCLPQSEGEVVYHTYYSLSYNETAEQANWVFYQIDINRTLGQVSRTDDFRSDEKISTNSATVSDYKGSGFDRGHLAPAGDMSFNYTAMSKSFYMSNMSPQHPSFNRGIWKKLEGLVRSWGTNSSIYVVTGPILNSCNSYIGTNNVCVPNYFYKVIYNPENKKMISFILPNKRGFHNLEYYVCTTDSLEQLTNIDFFPILEDKLEEKLESEIHTELWIWTSSNINYKTKNTTLSTQCRGTTQKGLRCKNRTKNQKEYCHYHD